MIPMYEQIARAILSGQPTRLNTTRAYVRRVAIDIEMAQRHMRWKPDFDPTAEDDYDLTVCFDDGRDRDRVVSRTYALAIFRLVMEAETPEAEPVILKFPGVA